MRNKIDVAWEWEYEVNKFLLMKNIQNFMKTYQKNEVRSRNGTYTNFVFSEYQKLVLDNIDKQIINIRNNNISEDVKIRCVVQWKTEFGKSTIIHEMVKRITNNFVSEAVKIAAYTVGWVILGVEVQIVKPGAQKLIFFHND